MPGPMPVNIRGKLYPSAAAAARALGLAPRTVCNAVDRGTIDGLGKGPGYRRPESRRGGRPKPLAIGGVKFESLSAADRALGLHLGWTSQMLRRGVAAQRSEFVGRVMKFKAEQEARARKAAEREACHG